MKAFIVAALLVASVAGQSLDTYKSMDKEMTLSRKGMMSNRHLKNFPSNYYYGGDYSNMINGEYDYPTYTTEQQKYYGEEEEMYNNVFSYEQITAQPLFREYMALPLFRQFWSYPMFQRYVCSHYFQQYWTMPAFQQYFVQPAMFYKYIYPIVQLYKYDAATSTNYNNYYNKEGGDYYSFWNKNAYPVGADYYFQGQQQQQQFIPTMCYSNSVYCRALVQKLYNHLMITMNGQETTTPMEFNQDMYKYNPYYARMMFPTVYNKEYYPTVYNKEQYPTVYNKEYYPTVYNKEYYPTVYNKEYFPTVYNKEFYPTVYNKEHYPTVYNKEFQNFEVPSKMVINNEQDMIRPVFTKPMIQHKTFGENKFQMPVQKIEA